MPVQELDDPAGDPTLVELTRFSVPVIAAEEGTTMETLRERLVPWGFYSPVPHRVQVRDTFCASLCVGQGT